MRVILLVSTTMLNILRAILNDDSGQDITEYALLATLILLMVASAVMAIGTNAKIVFTAIVNGAAEHLRAN